MGANVRRPFIRHAYIFQTDGENDSEREREREREREGGKSKGTASAHVSHIEAHSRQETDAQETPTTIFIYTRDAKTALTNLSLKKANPRNHIFKIPYPHPSPVHPLPLTSQKRTQTKPSRATPQGGTSSNPGLKSPGQFPFWNRTGGGRTYRRIFWETTS